MPRLSTSKNVYERLRICLDRLLSFANYELEDCESLIEKVIVRWSGDGLKNYKLIIQGELKFLVELIFQQKSNNILISQFRNDFKVLKDFLKILEDNRTKTQGSKEWHFTITLWSKKKEVNLAEFKNHWRICKMDQSLNDKLFRETANHNNIFLAEAPEIREFYGRVKELDILEKWCIEDGCRLIAILGMGGIGKTYFIRKFLENKKTSKFQYILWYSLREVPSFEIIATDLISIVSNQKEAIIPNSIDNKLKKINEYLNKFHCLVILDNFEAIFEENVSAGTYRSGFKSYGDFLNRVGTYAHKSCIVITTREKPKEIFLLENNKSLVRSITLKGLRLNEAKNIFKFIGEFLGTTKNWENLIYFYSGNPQALMIIAKSIDALMDGDVDEFVEERIKQNFNTFDSIDDLLDRQIERLSDAEKCIMYYLSINREFASKKHIISDLNLERYQIWQGLLSLQNRSLIEKNKRGFSLQNVVIEHMTKKLVDTVFEEIKSNKTDILCTYFLIKATAKDHVRQTQIILILKPIIQKLNRYFGTTQKTENKLLSLLKIKSDAETYLPGNILNLLVLLNGNLNNHDFSRLTIKQAYLQDIELKQTNFNNCKFVNSTFSKHFGGIHSVAFDPSGEIIALGDTEGNIRLISSSDYQELQFIRAHVPNAWVTSLVFTPDGEKLISGSFDKTIRIWNLKTGDAERVLQGHTAWVWKVALSPDGTVIASSGDDNKVILWDASNGNCLHILEGHSDWVWALSFTGDGKSIISGGYDNNLIFWDVITGDILKRLSGHKNSIWSIVCSHCGKLIISASLDYTVKIWDISKEICLHTLEGHTKEVRAIDISFDGEILASGSFDGTIRIWDIKTAICLRILRGHSIGIRTLAFHPKNRILVSGDNNQEVRFWNVDTGECIKYLHGYTNWLWSHSINSQYPLIAVASMNGNIHYIDSDSELITHSFKAHENWIWQVAFSPNGKTLASCSDDETIKLWNVATNKLLKVFRGHTKGGVWSINFHPNGEVIISAGQDGTVRFWNIFTGECTKIIQAHSNWIWQVIFSPSGELFASCGDDEIVQIYDSSTQKKKVTLKNSGKVKSLAFSPNEKTIATGDDSQKITLWDIDSASIVSEIYDESSMILISSISFSSDGQKLVSCSDDKTVKLWNCETNQCIQTFEGHTNWVVSVSFDLEGQTLVSSSADGSLKVWELKSGNIKQTFLIPKPYDGMKINDVEGLSESVIETLLQLGAVQNKQKKKRRSPRHL